MQHPCVSHNTLAISKFAKSSIQTLFSIICLVKIILYSINRADLTLANSEGQQGASKPHLHLSWLEAAGRHSTKHELGKAEGSHCRGSCNTCPDQSPHLVSSLDVEPQVRLGREECNERKLVWAQALHLANTGCEASHSQLWTCLA